MNSQALASALAAGFLSGALTEERIVDCGARLMGKRWRWLRPLARRVRDEFQGKSRPRQITLARFLLIDPGFQRACLKHDLWLETRQLKTVMAPVSIATNWTVPTLHTAGDLADWLQLSGAELEWFADLRTLEAKWNRGRLRHYRYRVLSKRFGRIRLIEAPKERLKALQRQVLSGILNCVPPHEAVHGFRPGHSIQTFAEPHVGQRVVLKLDLEDFFPSVRSAQVQSAMRAVGYPEAVADLLGGLCTNSTPADVWSPHLSPDGPAKTHNLAWRYSQPHLPQGSPSSPALANLCAFHLDCRLSGLAKAAGAVYTRYADDLAFSGGSDFERVARQFSTHVAATVMEEGFAVHHRKTRLMKQGVSQRLAGLIVNNRLNAPRRDFDRLKATLTNCVRHGPDSQNRAGMANFRSHLLGRLAFLERVNPTRGGRLRKLFERIEW